VTKKQVDDELVTEAEAITIREAWEVLRALIEEHGYRDPLTTERLRSTREFNEFDGAMRDVFG
jgi:hypothetical protein